MKPLLRRAPLTDEDWAVWLRFENRPGWYGYSGYVASDRRDAELMYTLTGGGQALGCHAARMWVAQRLPEAYV